MSANINVAVATPATKLNRRALSLGVVQRVLLEPGLHQAHQPPVAQGVAGPRGHVEHVGPVRLGTPGGHGGRCLYQLCAPAAGPLSIMRTGMRPAVPGPTPLPAVDDITYFYRTNFIKSAELAKGLQDIGIAQLGLTLRPSGDNALLFQGPEDAVAMGLDAAAFFDIPAPQVFIEARVIEITYESNFEFGLDYLWSRETNGPGTLFRSADSFLPAPSALSSLLPGGRAHRGR